MAASQTWVNTGETFGDADLRIVCLACKHVATSVEQHNTHLAGADHPDKGEAYR